MPVRGSPPGSPVFQRETSPEKKGKRLGNSVKGTIKTGLGI
jgi:hypothetical protein